jgi:hypothetical protein
LRGVVRSSSSQVAGSISVRPIQQLAAARRRRRKSDGIAAFFHHLGEPDGLSARQRTLVIGLT